MDVNNKYYCSICKNHGIHFSVYIQRKLYDLCLDCYNKQLNDRYYIADKELDDKYYN